MLHLQHTISSTRLSTLVSWYLYGQDSLILRPTPTFILQIVLTAIHGSERVAKHREGQRTFIRWITSGGCKVNMGVGAGPIDNSVSPQLVHHVGS